MPKSYRIRTQVGVDKYINVNLEQDWESLEILSLKILANDVYTRFCADYGVVTGRVFVNNGFGLPNAKVSVFIPLEPSDELDPVITELYPFKTITDTTEDGYRYNLLPKTPSYSGHTSTGSFPNKADILMDGSYIEVFDKYYRFTVSTNESGDFMIFGVPVGTQTIVMDVDLSDIGCFSLSPQDLILQGLATETQVNGAKFKSSTNLSELPQIKNLVFDVDVRPFWGDNDLCQVGITRVDFDLSKQANVTIQPTAVFMGSIISTTDDDALGTNCKPKNNTGNLCELVAGPGEIQAIRQTIFSDDNGLPILERYEIEEGGKVIDGDGAYLVNVPMNLDYVYTNEFGELTISNDPKIGVPTKGKYRFKFRWQNEQGLRSSFLRADFLVPNVKEYGWESNDDPFETYDSTPYQYTIPIGSTSGTTYTLPTDLGLSLSETTNVDSYQILINGTPYTGSLNSVLLNNGDTFQIIGTPIDNTQIQIFDFKQYDKQLFDLLRSYTFSTDWDDYTNVNEAINCEDTFYEFNFNKVYTTAMFLDRYKNGIGRARHLGIKEIDNRSCKSTVNTFPVNDIIRNFDSIFFVFNILINILTFPILVLLFVAHLIALLWPVLKYVLLFLGPFIVAMGVKSAVDLAYYILSLTNFAPLGGPVISVANILQIISQGLYSLATIAAGIVFTAFYTKFFINNTKNGKIDNFPRIGLPMISYPDCTSCDCECGTASLDDDFTANSIQQEIQDAEDGLDGGSSYDLVVTKPNSLIAPLNSPQSYNVTHPNLENDENNDPKFDCGFANSRFKSFVNLVGGDDINQDVVVRAALDYQRIFSGYDVISSNDPNRYISNESYLLKSPQPFLFSADKDPGDNTKDERYFAFPTSVTLSQRLNEFNTRDKYFYSNTSNTPNSGVNRIKTTVNPTLGSTPYEDQVVVVLMNAGSTSQIGPGSIVTFQDPSQTNVGSPQRLINLTGATINQFNNNAITGVTKTGITTTYVNYANPSDPTQSLQSTIVINTPNVSSLPVLGDPTVEQSYLQFATDMEYFQLMTGVTISQFNTLSQNTTGYFPQYYLGHDTTYVRPNCDLDAFIPMVINNTVQYLNDYLNMEICIFVRGVDPNTPPQTINYDISKIFGYTNYGSITVEGDYYLNIPIQPSSNGVKPISHNSTTNNVNNLYFPSFTFTPDVTSYTAFTSNYPYFYLSTDDSISSGYSPLPGLWNTNTNSTLNLTTTLTNNLSVPLGISTYVVGGSYIRWNSTFTVSTFYQTGSGNSCDQDCQKAQYYNHPTTGSYFITQAGLMATYSPAYYRYQSLNGVNFSDPTRIIMRSDRIPTSTSVQNGANENTGFGLHQNDNFSFYLTTGVLSPPSIFAGGDLTTGESNDDSPFITGLTSTLTCEGMVPLSCYSGSGSNVGVLPQGQCTVPANRMINGCYCLLNKRYVAEYGDDVRLFLEWKVRFTMNFAACRGIFAQTFQNNWINGVLYMFNFNKRNLIINQQNDYKYCNDVIVFNELTNTFFYRSSPWNETTEEFVGKQSPSTPIGGNLLKFPGLGYNARQIQFPTTVVDLGPRDSFINEICCTPGDGDFGSYFSDQIKSTSYQDNSSIVQLGFLSRILNEGVRQRMIPISAGGDNSEGKGIIQFFNSTRGGYRIDGDWAQMLSINSEWKVLPFITENIPSANYVYFGDNQNGNQNSLNSKKIKPIMGLFFEVEDSESRYRKIMSPGIETYSFNPLLEEKFGYPKSQVVPHYRWSITTPDEYVGTPNIFGSENNNWFTNATSQSGFYRKKYQDLDFDSPSGKYQTTITKDGFLSSFDLNGEPLPITPLNNIIQGAPSPTITTSSVTVVGAPYHFYFGLNNGKTAINRFYKLYVPTDEE